MAKTNARSSPTRLALMEATLRVAARSGIAAVTYRRVVAEAGVSLGTASYHFDDFDDMLFQSFSHFIRTVAARYQKHLHRVTNKDDLADAVLSVIAALESDDQDTVLILTLYSEAARNPVMGGLVRAWSKEVKQNLSHVVDELTVTKLELIWDGAMLQRAVFHQGLGDAEIRKLVLGVLNA